MNGQTRLRQDSPRLRRLNSSVQGPEALVRGAPLNPRDRAARQSHVRFPRGHTALAAKRECSSPVNAHCVRMSVDRPVDLGVPVAEVESEERFVLNWQVMWDEQDVEVACPLVRATQAQYPQAQLDDRGVPRRARYVTDRQDRRECGRNRQTSVDWAANPGKIQPDASVRRRSY